MNTSKPEHYLFRLFPEQGEDSPYFYVSLLSANGPFPADSKGKNDLLAACREIAWKEGLREIRITWTSAGTFRLETYGEKIALQYPGMRKPESGWTIPETSRGIINLPGLLRYLDNAAQGGF